MNSPWVTNFKETPADGGEVRIEYSIVRESNKHGILSWGWDSDEKIIMFDTVIYRRHRIRFKNICKVCADALNARGM